MGKFSRDEFIKGAEVFCRKSFTFNGKLYLPGMMFDWDRQSVPRRKIMTMFKTGHLCHDFENTSLEKTDAQPIDVTQPKPETPETEAPADEGDEGGEAATPPAENPPVEEPAAAEPAPEKPKKKK